MGNHQLPYINLCKKRIEAELNWSHASEGWKQRDYLNFIELLENKTGILLSLSTVKRIWQQSYDGTPHPSTLDALAQFLDYKDWLSFQAAEKLHIQNTAILPDPSGKDSTSPSNLWLFGLTLVFMAGVVIWYFLVPEDQNRNTVIIANQAVPFTAQNSKTSGLPNTVIFNFDLSSVDADSFFIQQSWNPENRERINKGDSVLTSIYYYPGVHTAKLIANDSIISETTVQVYSPKWIAAIRDGEKDLIPTYLSLPQSQKHPLLSISKSQLLAQHIEIQKGMILNYVLVDDFEEKVSGDDFTLSLKIKADSLMNLTCPIMGIVIIGEKETHAITLIEEGCVHKAFAKFGEVSHNGRNTDLSKLGIKPYEWQSLRVMVGEKQGRVFLQEDLVLDMAYQNSIGHIVGFNIYFTGIGQIDSLHLENNKTGEHIYSNAID